MSTQTDTPLATFRKLWLGCGTLTLLLVVAVLAIVLRLSSVEVQVSEMANARARAAAARELEINALDFALGVRQYLDTGERETRATMADDAAGVEQSKAEYDRLATTDQQREMASRVDALWGELEGLGQALVDAEPRRPGQEELTRFNDLRLRLERVLDEEVQREGEDEYNARRESAVRDVRNVEAFALIALLVCAVIAVLTGGTVGGGVVQAERAVRENRELLRVTLASIGDGVMTTDVDGRVTYFNAIAEALTGWTNDQARGLSLTQVFRIINEDTRQPAESPAMRALREGAIVGLANHTVLIAKDGTERPIDDSAAPIRDENGNVVGCVLIFRDITERRKTEHALKEIEARKAAILETALDCIITMDHEGKIVDFNPASERTFGYRRADVLGREMCELLMPPSLRQRHRQGLARYLATGEGQMLGKRLELTALRADDTEFPIELAISRISSDGPPVFTGYLRDITERKEMENTLQQLVADLSEADRRKNEFLAILAHELRSPLAPIRNAVEILRRSGPNDPAVNSATEMMERQVGQMVRLIEDLLDVSRISQGKIDLRLVPVELASVVHHAVEASQPLFESTGLELTVTLPPKPMYVHADAARLAQVIGNLLNNAAKFTRKGDHVWLAIDQEGGHAVIRVRDTGIGIAPDQCHRVFDLFVQVDTTLERTQSGLGIGLTLAKSLVERHDGTIDVHSAGLGRGTEFVIRLPVLVEMPESLSSPPSSGHGKVTATSRRVLVVDDNVDSAESMAMLMELSGHQVRMAHDGLQAVDVATSFLPDVVLLDIGLPELNGYEVAQRIRQLPSGKRIFLVALTGWGQDADRRRSTESGFDVHLVKPVDHDALTKLMADLPSAEAP